MLCTTLLLLLTDPDRSVNGSFPHLISTAVCHFATACIYYSQVVFFGWFKSFPKTPFNSSQSVVATPVKWNVFTLKVSRDPKHTHPFICCRFWRDDVLHSLTIIIFCVLYNTCQRSLLLDLACMTQIPFIESTFWWTMSLSLNWIWFFLLLTIFSCSILYLLLNPFACWQRNTFSISLSILKAKPAYFTWNNDPDWLCFA